MRSLLLAGAVCLLVGCSLQSSRTDDGIGVPGLDAGMSEEERSEYFTLVGLEKQLPRDFIGCLDENRLCYVFGSEVDAELRFEPQSGRYWFLDPDSGNTYFFNGDLRTGDPLLMVPPPVQAELPEEDDESTEDHTG
ncbi:hypothetical protein [Parvularcula maris]|uniref:Lipoprotein n=1 Tax=Parvularcula maris TaxID=2965077 RepID=A0A9X2LBG6_9PROT|nr:hypothetical protein [Parvularcula maris]MCQ8186418.1 hypothetical protein [Parvularcula maris]